MAHCSLKDDRPGRSSLVLFALGLALLAAWALLSLPQDYSFGMFGFADPGGDLTLYEELARGRIPYRDFSYEYGLLPLPLGLLWFTIFGRTPATYLAAVFLCNVLILWAFTRFARALEVRIVGKTWLLVTLGVFVPSNYVTVGHALEAVLITHALAELARGHRSSALALATAALFTRPCMAYFLGLLLLVLLVVEARRAAGSSEGGRWFAAFGRSILPAFVTGVALLGLLSVRFGPAVALESLLPLTGMREYEHMGYTPSHLLRAMLLPNVKHLLNYYLGTHTAMLVLGTLALTICAGSAGCRVRRGPLERKQADCLLACAALNVAFYAIVSGPIPQYMYLIGLGVTAMEATGVTARRFIMVVLIPIACLGYYSDIRGLRTEWSHKQADQRLGGLWCSQEMASDWFRARDLTRGENPALLSRTSGYHQLFDGFVRPTSRYLDRGLQTETELHREVVRLQRARYVVRPTQGLDRSLLEIFPEFAAALAPMQVIWKGPYFMVYRRTEPEGSHDRGENP
jgi:hypothetical protein